MPVTGHSNISYSVNVIEIVHLGSFNLWYNRTFYQQIITPERSFFHFPSDRQTILKLLVLTHYFTPNHYQMLG